MTTVVNTPAQSGGSDNSMGMVVGIIVVIGFAFLFFVYGLPMMRSTNGTSNTQNSAPAPAAVVPPIEIPDKIDVNVKQE